MTLFPPTVHDVIFPLLMPMLHALPVAVVPLTFEVPTVTEPDSVKQPEVLQEIEEQSDTEMQQKAGKVIGNEKQSEAETSSEHRKQ